MSHFSNPLKRNEISTPSLSPQQTNYSEGSFRGTYWEGENKYATAGPCYLSTAKPGQHALPPDALRDGHQPISSWYTLHVDSGIGTVVPNIGFAVRIDYNKSHEPAVRVYPYALDAAKGGFLDPRIDTVVSRICSEIARHGISIPVLGQLTDVAPREIVGETTVLDIHGKKPAQWSRPRDEAASLKSTSFSYRR